MAVLKTTSPERSAGAPKLLPSKTVPSSKARIAESNSSFLLGVGSIHCIGSGSPGSGVAVFGRLRLARSGFGFISFSVSFFAACVPFFFSLCSSILTRRATFAGCAADSEKWSAPLPDKPSDRGLFGLPEDTGAAPITGAPAAHCFKLLRHGLENLAGSDQKHHEYVLVLDCTVADRAGDSFYGRVAVARKLLIRPGETLFSTFVTLGLKKSPWQRFRYVVQLVP